MVGISLARFAVVALGVLTASSSVLAATPTVISTLKDLPDAQFAYAAFQSSDLASELSDPSLVATIFVPTNEAFASAATLLGQPSAGALASSATEGLDKYLAYSVIPGESFTTDELESGIVLHTLLDGSVVKVISGNASSVVLKTGSLQLVSLVGESIKAGLSTIQLVDALLIPDGVAAQAGYAPVDVTAATLAPELEEASIEITYYAPAPEAEP